MGSVTRDLFFVFTREIGDGPGEEVPGNGKSNTRYPEMQAYSSFPIIVTLNK